MLLHHRLVHELVRQHVLPRRIVNDDRRVADNCSEVMKRHGVHPLSAANADCAEFALPIAANDAVDVFPTVRRDARADDVDRCGLKISH